MSWLGVQPLLLPEWGRQPIDDTWGSISCFYYNVKGPTALTIRKLLENRICLGFDAVDYLAVDEEHLKCIAVIYGRPFPLGGQCPKQRNPVLASRLYFTTSLALCPIWG